MGSGRGATGPRILCFGGAAYSNVTPCAECGRLSNASLGFKKILERFNFTHIHDCLGPAFQMRRGAFKASSRVSRTAGAWTAEASNSGGIVDRKRRHNETGVADPGPAEESQAHGARRDSVILVRLSWFGNRTHQPSERGLCVPADALTGTVATSETGRWRKSPAIPTIPPPTVPLSGTETTNEGHRWLDGSDRTPSLPDQTHKPFGHAKRAPRASRRKLTTPAERQRPESNPVTPSRRTSRCPRGSNRIDTDGRPRSNPSCSGARTERRSGCTRGTPECRST